MRSRRLGPAASTSPRIPPITRLLEEVAAGATGRVRMVAIREHRFPFLAKVDHWNRFNRNTGGTLVERCCHFFDLMRLVVGDDPVRVLASGAQDVNHLDETYGGEVTDLLDNAYVIVDFAGGARGCLDLCMFAEAGRHEQEVCVVGGTGKVEALAEAVRSGARPAVDVEDGSWSVATGIAAHRAIELRRPVDLAEVLG